MALFGCGSTRDYLKIFGYGTISLPREGIKPLLMMIKNGNRLTPLGPLTGTFQAGASPLPVIDRHVSTSISGKKSTATNVDIGLNIVGTLINALSGSSLGLKAAYKNTRKVQFEFGEVMEDSVTIEDLDGFLTNGTVAAGIGNFVKKSLEDDEVYIIISTVDAKQISVEATSESGSSVGLDIPVIQGIVGGKVGVSGSGASTSKLTYASTTTPLSFGLQVVQLIIKNGKYTTLKTVSPGGVNAFAAGPGAGPTTPAPAIAGPGLRIEL